MKTNRLTPKVLGQPWSKLAALGGVFATFALSGCAAKMGQQAQHADNLIELAASSAGYGHQDIAPIEIVPGTTARIVSAHAVTKGQETLVYGYLQPVVRMARGSGAHVDVLMVGKNGQKLGHAADVYMVPGTSLRTRGNMRARASFAVTLPPVPEGASFRVFHHGVAKTKCSLKGEA